MSLDIIQLGQYRNLDVMIVLAVLIGWYLAWNPMSHKTQEKRHNARIKRERRRNQRRAERAWKRLARRGQR